MQQEQYLQRQLMFQTKKPSMFMLRQQFKQMPSMPTSRVTMRPGRELIITTLLPPKRRKL
jgi:hypothetical protein